MKPNCSVCGKEIKGWKDEEDVKKLPNVAFCSRKCAISKAKEVADVSSN